MIKQFQLALVVAALAPVVASADTLSTWNVDDIQATGDVVEVILGTTTDAAGNTVSTLTIQWKEGDTSDSISTATALDQFYFNTTGTDWAIVQVIQEDGLGGSFDDTSSWDFGVGGTTSGAGGIFGSFASKNNKEAPADTGGIEPNSTTFIFNTTITLDQNSYGATAAAHVRYGDDNCSGWVSNPEFISPDDRSSGTCVSTPVPEPAPLALLALGFLGMALTRKVIAR